MIVNLELASLSEFLKVVWFSFALIVSAIAHAFNRARFIWFIIGLTGPVGLLILVILGKKPILIENVLNINLSEHLIKEIAKEYSKLKK